MRPSQLLPFIPLCLLWACSSFDKNDFDVKKISGTPSFYAPVAFADITLRKALKKSKEASTEILIKDDGLLYQTYSGAKNSKPAGEVITLPARQPFTSTHHFQAAPSLPPTATDKRGVTTSRPASFNFDTKRLEEIKFKKGTVNIKVNMTPDTHNKAFGVEVKFPSCKKNGAPLILITKAAIGTDTGIPLDDYIMTLGKDNTGNPNTFDYEVTLIEKSHTQNISHGGFDISVTLEFTNISYRYLKGYLGEYSFHIPLVEYGLEQRLLDKLKEADITFAAPSFDMEIYNGFGAPSELAIAFEAEDSKGGRTPFQLSKPSPVTLEIPSALGQPRAITKLTVTNAKDGVNKNSKYFRGTASGTVNKGNTPSPTNFCADTSTFGWRTRLEIPYYGVLGKFELRDTLALSVNLSDLKVGEVQEAVIVLKATNQIPLDLRLQIYLADGAAKVLGALLTSNDNLIVKSSSVNDQGELQAASEINKEITIDKETLKKLSDAKKIIFVATLATGGQPRSVKLKADQSIKMQIGFKATLNTSYITKK